MECFMKTNTSAFRLIAFILSLCSILSFTACADMAKEEKTQGASVKDAVSVISREEYSEYTLPQGAPLEEGKDYVLLEKGIVYDFPVVAVAGDVQNDAGDVYPYEHFTPLYLEQALPPATKTEVWNLEDLTVEDVLKAWDYAAFSLSEEFYQLMKAGKHENITAQFVFCGPDDYLLPNEDPEKENEWMEQPYACLYEDFSRIYGTPDIYIVDLGLVRADEQNGIYIFFHEVFIGKEDFEALMAAYGIEKMDAKSEEITDFFKNSPFRSALQDFESSPYAYKMPKITRDTIREATPEQLRALYRVATGSMLFYNQQSMKNNG